MAEGKGNTGVPQHGDRDRVVMLSLQADGTPDQHNPELIGDKRFALAATREQFRQQAVSAVDQRERATGQLSDGAQTVGQDPTIAELTGKHEAAEQAATSAADATVDALYDEDSAPAGSAAAVEKTGDKPAVKPSR